MNTSQLFLHNINFQLPTKRKTLFTPSNNVIVLLLVTWVNHSSRQAFFNV